MQGKFCVFVGLQTNNEKAKYTVLEKHKIALKWVVSNLYPQRNNSPPHIIREASNNDLMIQREHMLGKYTEDIN